MLDRLRAAVAGVGFIGPVHLRAARLPAPRSVGISGAAPDGLPTFHDGLRAAHITEAVLASARSRAWEEVPR